MIKTFREKETKKIWEGLGSRKLPREVQNRALNKLRQLDAALTLEDLRNPPGNQLEVLSGDRKGQRSIRINSRWRLCFVWQGSDAYNVEITDYH